MEKVGALPCSRLCSEGSVQQGSGATGMGEERKWLRYPGSGSEGPTGEVPLSPSAPSGVSLPQDRVNATLVSLWVLNTQLFLGVTRALCLLS